MKIRISAECIHRGKAIADTRHTASLDDTESDIVPAIGSIVMESISKARAQRWYMNDPETWVRVEFREYHS